MKKRTYWVLTVPLFVIALSMFIFSVIVILKDISKLLYLVNYAVIVSVITSVVVFILLEKYTKIYHNKTFLDMYKNKPKI
jgi:amino acid transporter